jgi:hypothetical protein
MKPLHCLAALAATLLTQGALAQLTVSIQPVNPTPADTVELVIATSGPTCLTVPPDGVRFQGENLIRVAILPATGSCLRPAPTLRVALGRFPLGSYNVRWGANDDAAGAFTVTLPAGTGTPAAVAPFENYSGVWVTGVAGEGVSITQYGPTVFLSYQTYGPDGLPLWVVMSDGKWEYDASLGLFRFRGPVYITRRLAGNVLAVAPVGDASLYPVQGNSDAALLQVNVEGMAGARLLTKFRF